MILASLTKDTSLLLKIFPNSSTAALLGVSAFSRCGCSLHSDPLCTLSKLPTHRNARHDNNKLFFFKPLSFRVVCHAYIDK